MDQPSDWKILLIDDEKDICLVMTITLEDAGYQVVTAQDGDTGIRICKEASPQIVITDIRMPGMSGIQVLEAVKEHDPNIEVIVVSGFADMNLAIQALQLDASDFITKPINDDALFIALDRAKSRYTTKKQLQEYTAFLEEGWTETTQELLETFSYQRNLIESSMDGIIGCDEKDIVVSFNKSMERILGYPKNEVLFKMSLDRFFYPGEVNRLKEAIKGEKYGGENRLFLFETNLVNRSGHKIPVQVSATELFEMGQKSGLVCFFRDLQEIRRLEREMADQARILHQDKMISLGRLAASVVHEINNPLTGILNYIRLMIRIFSRGPLAENHQLKFQQYLDLVEKETQRCSQIISNLLIFSRKSPPNFESVYIPELLDRCTILSQHKLQLNNIQLVTKAGSDIPPVEGDLNQMQQCVINLIFNAIDAIPDGGTITIEGAYDPAIRQALIRVKDNGTGISEEDLPHIFEPFYTTKKEGYGVGLGLSTLYGIMERHNGRVRVESRPGEGTAFTLEFPA
ncbi:MAG: response regulator [Deltaproteobacteria bacterium]|nr:response regulator [Deltaproteobacteria bacterium]